jgi:hypothetical protein
MTRRNQMRGQVTRRILTSLLAGLLLAGCGSGKKAQVDAPLDHPPPPDAGATDQADVGTAPPADAVPLSQEPDAAGCDEDALGENYCIINSPGGGGTIVTRQNPINYSSCRL